MWEGVWEGVWGRNGEETICGEGSVGDTSVGGMQTFPYWVVTIIGVVERGEGGDTLVSRGFKDVDGGGGDDGLE